MTVGSGTSGSGGEIVLSAGTSLTETGGDVSITSGSGSATSSGALRMITSDAGTGGVSGMLVLSTGISTLGDSGALYIGSGASMSGHGGSLYMTVGLGSTSSAGQISIIGGSSVYPVSGGAPVGVPTSSPSFLASEMLSVSSFQSVIIAPGSINGFLNSSAPGDVAIMSDESAEFAYFSVNRDTGITVSKGSGPIPQIKFYATTISMTSSKSFTTHSTTSTNLFSESSVNIVASDGVMLTGGLSVQTKGLSVTGGVTITSGGANIAGGLNVTSGGVLVRSGGIKIAAGGASVSDGITITSGGMTAAGGVTVKDTGLTIAEGGLLVSSGGISVTSGGFNLSSGGATITGGLSVADKGLNVTGGLTVLDTGVRIYGGLSVISGAIYENQPPTVSDRRLKTDIVLLSDPLLKITKLRGVYFRWISDEISGLYFDEDRHVGLLAQDVQKILPEVVHEAFDGKYLSVDYIALVPLIVEAIKELNTADESILQFSTESEQKLRTQMEMNEMMMRADFEKKLNEVTEAADNKLKNILFEVKMLQNELERLSRSIYV